MDGTTPCDSHELEEIGQAAHVKSNPGDSSFRLFKCVNCHKFFRENPKKMKQYPTKPRWKKRSKVQSVVFKKSKWTLKKAKAWLKKNKFIAGKPDVTKTEFRFSQIPSLLEPGKFKHFASKPFGWDTGVRAIIAEPNPPSKKKE